MSWDSWCLTEKGWVESVHKKWRQVRIWSAIVTAFAATKGMRAVGQHSLLMLTWFCVCVFTWCKHSPINSHSAYEVVSLNIFFFLKKEAKTKQKTQPKYHHQFSPLSLYAVVDPRLGLKACALSGCIMFCSFKLHPQLFGISVMTLSQHTCDHCKPYLISMLSSSLSVLFMRILNNSELRNRLPFL